MLDDIIFSEMYKNDLVYSDACWLTAHNAFTYNWRAYAQQDMNLEGSFEYGVRSFMLDIHHYDKINNAALCHADCTLSYFQKLGEPEKAEIWFKNLHHILTTNTNDIITLHLESYIPGKNINNILTAAGLSSYLLKSKDPNDPTLTLGEMRTNNERLVVFSDYGAGHAKERNFTNFNDASNSMLKGIYYTTNYKETEYNLFYYKNCEMRIDNRASSTDSKIKLFVFNHFYSISKVGWPHEITNSYENIKKRVDSCSKQSLEPNFIAVDFVELGNDGGAKKVVFELIKKKTTHKHDEL